MLNKTLKIIFFKCKRDNEEKIITNDLNVKEKEEPVKIVETAKKRLSGCWKLVF